MSRYAINDASADWSTAEAQVAKLAAAGPGAQGKSTLVSVKTAGGAGQKRKADGAGLEEVKGKGTEKKVRRSMKKGGKR